MSRVITLRQSFSLPNIISMGWRRLVRRLLCLMGCLRDLRPGMQGLMPLSAKDSRNQLAS